LLVNTALLEMLTLPPCIVLALALAWLTERSDLPGARLWSWLAVAPLAIPAFVQSYAWIGVAPGMHGLFAACWSRCWPICRFSICRSRRNCAVSTRRWRMRPLRWASRPGGCSCASCCRNCGSRYAAARLLIGLHLLAEYGLYAMIRFDTFTTAIVDQFQSSYNGPAANMLAGVLVSPASACSGSSC
jgi:iron(III) transport system permease protein